MPNWTRLTTHSCWSERSRQNDCINQNLASLSLTTFVIGRYWGLCSIELVSSGRTNANISFSRGLYVFSRCHITCTGQNSNNDNNRFRSGLCYRQRIMVCEWTEWRQRGSICKLVVRRRPTANGRDHQDFRGALSAS